MNLNPQLQSKKCRHCKHWGTLKDYFDGGVGVCILRPSNRNKIGFKRQSANTPACQNFEPAYRFFY